jgi:zinc protease
MRQIKSLSLLLLILLCGVLTPAHAQQQLKKTLPNGLTVLVWENHAAPVVSVRVYVRTGSLYEGKYLGAGLSHLFEHTLFEGTKTRDKVAINNEIQAIGGQSNAYTSYDVTCYHVTTASSYFDRALGLLADMTQNATFPEAEVKVQQGVIHNEMNLGDDDPDRELGELFDRTAFRVHPARIPIIGYPEQFDALTRDDILSYYKSKYAPQNAVLSIAGDVKAADVFAAAEKAMGGWVRTATDIPTLPTEPTQTAPRRAVEERDVNVTYLQMGWHTIPLQNLDLYALDTLAQILGGGESSRLVRVIQEEKNLVSSISAYSQTPNYDAGVFAIRATLEPKNLRATEAAILAEVERIKKDGVTEAELARAKKQIRSAFIFNAQGVENEAEQMAYDEMGTGDPSYSSRYVNRVAAVTAEQVKEIANKYLRPDGLTTAVVQPRTKTAAAVAATKTVEVKPAQLVTLSNGVRLILRQNKTAPTVSISVMGLGGARLEDPAKAGVGNLTAAMLTRGTKLRNAEQLAQVVDDLGGSLSPFSGYNAWGVDSQWLAADWRKGISLVAESILEPTFPADELEKARAQTLAGIAQQDDDPMTTASLLLRKTFYGNHPYGRPSVGTAETVSKLTREDLVNYWASVLQPKNTVIAIYGDFDPARVQKAAEFLFGSFKATAPAPKAPAPVVVPSQFKQAMSEKPGLVQAVLWYGFASINVKDEDRYALDVLDAALSGADLPGGRLHARLRDNQLVYVVHAYDSPGVDTGMFVIYAATTKANRDKVTGIIQEEVNKVVDEEITPDELERAKSMSIAAHSIDMQTNGAQARTAATNELFGLGYQNDDQYAARINTVTLDDVHRMAQKYLKASRSALAVVEPK